MNKQFIAYYRVSTSKQGINGLGMAAQRNAVQAFLNGAPLAGEFSEVESGKNNQRPKLQEAIAACRKAKTTLVIAKLDRLSRDPFFLLNLRNSGVEFVCCDMPQADKFTVQIMALVAEKERDMISERTKAGLAAAKRRGTQLGNPDIAAARLMAIAANQERSRAFAVRLEPVLKQIEKAGVRTLSGIAECLNARGIKTPNGKEFSAQSVKNLKAVIETAL